MSASPAAAAAAACTFSASSYLFSRPPSLTSLPPVVVRQPGWKQKELSSPQKKQKKMLSKLARWAVYLSFGLWFVVARACLGLAIRAACVVFLGKDAVKRRRPSSRKELRHEQLHQEQLFLSSPSNNGDANSISPPPRAIYHSKTIKLRYRATLKKKKELVSFSCSSSRANSPPNGVVTIAADPIRRPRTTSEMSEFDDKIMPLPNIRSKTKRWKSCGSMHSTNNTDHHHDVAESNKDNLGSSSDEQHRRRALLLLLRRSGRQLSDPSGLRIVSSSQSAVRKRRKSDEPSMHQRRAYSSTSSSSSSSSSSTSPPGSPSSTDASGSRKITRACLNGTTNTDSSRQQQLLVAGEANLMIKSAQRGP